MDRREERLPCPCCGYRTLPSRGDYEVCPVCWWEDDGAAPWQVGGPNGTSLMEAQRDFLADARPFRRRPGRVRPPRRGEERDPGWTPIEVTPDLEARLAAEEAAWERRWEQDRQRVEAEIAANPEGPFREFNVEARRLQEEAATRGWREHRDLYLALAARHGFDARAPEVELMARWAHDPDHFHGHPLRTIAFLARHAGSGRLTRLRQAIRSDSTDVVG